MISITGQTLTLEDVERVALARERDLVLSPQAEEKVTRSRSFVEGLLEQNERIYGVTTGFGRLSEVFIQPPRRKDLQLNLIRSHASGLGSHLSSAEVRTMMLLRANSLARGDSGCRVEVVQRLIDFLRLGIHPVVPEIGSVGASGDLAPLAHVALALLGEGEVEMNGSVIPSRDALARSRLEPIELLAKEGLALINGTQATTGLGVLSLLAAERAIETSEVAGATSLEGLRGTPEPFRAEVQEARPHPGQIASAQRLRAILADSEIRESHRYNDPRVHDAYSLRCMPQVHGAARGALAYVRQVLEIEVNSTTDNPLIFPDAGVVLSAGNFHAQVVAQALDFLAIAVADVASISERRVERLLNPDLSGLPAFLARDPGIESGFMIAQVAAVDLLAEMRVLAHPASVDSVPTSGNKEDHVSMGMAAARKARRAVECLEYVLAIELLCAMQALEFLKPLRPGRGVLLAYEKVRQHVRALEGDRVLTRDIERLREMVHAGEFATLALQASERVAGPSLDGTPPARGKRVSDRR
jgi:histidine ammonia-lyase